MMPGRHDRKVRQCRLRVAENAPVSRLRMMTEEALRLCSLPGEAEGRVYYFRRVHIAGLPVNGDRRSWLEKFEAALRNLARNAVHGAQPDAHYRDAVFFRNAQEAFEVLLTAASPRRNPEPWFIHSISGRTAGASLSRHVTGAIAKLSRSDAAWVSVAAAIFGPQISSSFDPLVLLHLIPVSTARAWLEEFGGPGMPRRESLAAPLPIETMRILRRASNALGASDHRVVWLATLAVIFTAPSELGGNTAVARAVKALEQCALDPVRFVAGLPVPDIIDGGTAGEHAAPPVTALSEAPQPPPRSSTFHLQGEPTAAAGLYFLLNALRRLGIAHRDFGPAFVPGLLKTAALHSGIETGDPVYKFANAAISEAGPAEQIDERLLRVWLRKVRRWCWRNGKIGLREIVRRPGLVTLTRTHLDVSLALETADVRIRRMGLDLDPGWLPWFGRVVYFHYRPSGELRGEPNG